MTDLTAPLPALMPAGLTPDLADILGLMCFHAAPIAHCYQALGRFVDIDGKPLKHRIEQEQAFVIFRMLTHWSRDPGNWVDSWAAELDEIAVEARAKTSG
jgi:hypothetical protein